jgi:hypothetical protein
MRSRVAATVLAMVLVIAASVLTGCGGAAVEEPQTTVSGSGAVPAPPAQPAATTAVADRTPEESTAYEPFPTNPNVTPAAVQELLQAKQPMLVLFYDSTQKTTNDERSGISGKDGIDKIMADYRGTIDLVSYDIGRFVTTAADGSISVAPEFADDAAAQQAVTLATTLGVKFTPYVVIVDGNGYIIARFRGWDDYKNIEREVLRATS